MQQFNLLGADNWSKKNTQLGKRDSLKFIWLKEEKTIGREKGEWEEEKER